MGCPTVLLADDHVLVAEGIAKLLEGNFELVGRVTDGNALVDAVLEKRPDLIVADIGLPGINGLEAARRIRQQVADAKIVFLSMHTHVQYVREALRVGARGYVSKQAASRELLVALERALEGGTYITPAIPPEAISGVAEESHQLTPRQRQVLQMVAEGRSGKEIAHLLSISPKTVEFHKSSIMQKLGIRTTAQLTKYALEHELIGSSYSNY